MKYVVVGSGVAGVCCVEELCRLSPEDEVTLISADATLKAVDNVKDLSSKTQEFDVVEVQALPHPNLTTIRALAVSLDWANKKLLLSEGDAVNYDKLCICTGAAPKRVAHSENVVVLRDRDTVQDLASSLQKAQKLLLIGNGGIALELVHALQGVDIVWAVKHSHIGDAFFDSDAAAFLFTELEQNGPGSQPAEPPGSVGPLTAAAGNGSCDHQPIKPHDKGLQRRISTSFCQRTGRVGYVAGSAVGPHWTEKLQQSGGSGGGTLLVEHGCELQELVPAPADTTDAWAVHAKLTNGEVHGVDMVVAAIGVSPNIAWLGGQLQTSERDDGLEVDQHMQTSAAGVYAAGDVCTATSLEAASPHWFQMRLWTQARVMGMYAAHCMVGAAEAHGSSFSFELFTHVTRFCGKKVVLLGLYNGQRLEQEPDADIITYSRCTEGPDSTFVRVLLLRGRLQGAVLIGDTDLEETFENLILDQIDLSSFGPSLLDPDMELDHIFD